MRQRAEGAILGVFGIAAALGSWAAISWSIHEMGWSVARFVPAPWSVAARGADLSLTLSFWDAMLASNARVFTAFLVAMAVGVSLGLATAWSETSRRILQPVLVLLRYVPIAALVPISIIFIGVTFAQKIAVLFFGTVFYIIVLVQDAVLRFPQTHIDSARSLGLTKTEIFWRVLVPGIGPEVYDTGRVAISLTWSYLLVAEVVAAETGMGVLLIRAQRFLQIEQMLFVTIVLALLGMAYDYAFVTARRFVFRWL